ncbi:MAG TPA: class I tRNA ligase family protein [Tepidisphaeraceae bacterium]|jgi:methionyl-tRNA synthetase|nr:class I tRNA ligase family protein [Tepidisphaeraceae bacterium]
MPKFYITTPIYYPNAEPHLGHVYTTICADVLARYHRLAGDDTFFLTGTDEHGIKMVKTAAERNITPQQLADQNVAVFESLWKELNITNDDFIRTSSPRHKQSVQKIVEKLVASGDIYLGSYQGWYDEGQEEFVTETEAKDRQYLAFNRKPLVRYSEPTYFFKLKKYIPQVQAYIESHPDFIQPLARRNEVLSKLKQGVEDLSISRATLKWGIELPHDPGHVLYVWIDALSNYITALGYPALSDEATKRRSDEGKESPSLPSSLRRSVAPSLFDQFWPADVHLIGKEIMWFHTVYWPAMLFALGIDQPKQVYAHGWWTADGRKMSKTEGNFIDLAKLRGVIATHSLDALRYYLLRAAPFGNDLDWSDSEFNSAYTELGNVIGNCLNRVLNMANKYLDGIVPPDPGPATGDDLAHSLFIEKYTNFPQSLAARYNAIALQDIILVPLELARATNGYIDSRAPFKLAKDPAKAGELQAVMWRSIQSIYRVLVALLPILPEKAAAGLTQLGVDLTAKSLPDLFSQPLPAGHKLGANQPLFPKIEPAA